MTFPNDHPQVSWTHSPLMKIICSLENARFYHLRFSLESPNLPIFDACFRHFCHSFATSIATADALFTEVSLWQYVLTTMYAIHPKGDLIASGLPSGPFLVSIGVKTFVTLFRN